MVLWTLWIPIIFFTGILAGINSSYYRKIQNILSHKPPLAPTAKDIKEDFLGQSDIAILKRNPGYNNCLLGAVHINCLLFLVRLTSIF